MNDIQLTKHFMLSEFLKSDTATKLKIPNIPDLDQVSNLQYLCREVLEPLREWMNEPIVISSGYRCPMLNKAVGGVTNSQHLTGQAADIRIPWIQSSKGSSVSKVQDLETGRKYAEFILDNCRFDQMLFETDSNGTSWLHVSIKQQGHNRQTYKPNYKA